MPPYISVNILFYQLCDISGSPEEENQVESFESDLARVAREADPGKGQRKVVKDKKKSKKTQKKKRNNKNAQRKKTRSNKKKGLKGKKGGKGQKQKRKNRKNGLRSGKGKKKSGKRNNKKKSEKKKNKKKAKRRQKKRGKKGEKKRKNGDKKRKNGDKKRKNGDKKRKNKAEARDSTCDLSTTCVNLAVNSMRMIKDKVANFETQYRRITKKSKLGDSKSSKQNEFLPVLARLSDGAGGNISAPVCSGSTNNTGAETMKNISMTLMSCADEIAAACDTGLPSVNETHITECVSSITIFKNYTDTCLELSGSEACACWTAAPTEAIEVVQGCDISGNNTAITKAANACKATFGVCRKAQDSVGNIIFDCSQSADTLKLKLKALSDNNDKVAAAQAKVSGLVNSSRASGKFKRSARDATTASGFISICTTITTYVTQNPYYYQIATLSQTIVTVTAPVFSGADLASLSDVNTALQVSVSTLATAVTTLQTSIFGKML